MFQREIIAVSAWGDGPDVLLQVRCLHAEGQGFATLISIPFTAEEAIKLADEVREAARDSMVIQAQYEQSMIENKLQEVDYTGE